MIHSAAVTSLVLYLLATVLYLIQLWRPSRTGRLRGCATVCTKVGLVLHTLTALAVLASPELFIQSNGADYFLWVSWLLSAVFVAFGRFFHYPLLGAWIVPAVVLFMGSSSYLLHRGSYSLVDNVQPAPEGGVIPLLHALPALVALVSLVLAFVVSSTFLLVERRLKRRKAVVSLCEPGLSLQRLDLLNSHLIRIGFVAISLVIVSGGLWAVSLRNTVFTLDSSVISGLLIWIMLGGITFVRFVANWSPRRVSKLTVLAAGSFITSLFVALVLSGRTAHVALKWW
jgi:ABC-type transport system involved in cytochrome c biogenesis permease subunit